MGTPNYENLITTKNVSTGAWTSVTIPAGGVVQGADIPCRFLRLQSRDGNAAVRVRIGAACGSDSGVGLPTFPTLTPYPVSNLNLLYFYGTNTNVVDVEYFR